MTDMSVLHAQQRAFANHLRDPQRHPAPVALADDRLAVYRRLFFNNIRGLLGSNFPVIRATLGDMAWHALVQTFYADHAAHTPLFPQIGRELVDWLRRHPVPGLAVDISFEPEILGTGGPLARADSEEAVARALESVAMCLQAGLTPLQAIETVIEAAGASPDRHHAP